MPRIVTDLEGKLRPREKDIALFDCTVRAEQYESMGPQDVRFVDLSQSIGRSPTGWNVCPTVTPGAKVMVVNGDRSRMLHPFEALRFQGLGLNMLSDKGAQAIANLTEKQLQSLAGNAFSSNHVCVAAIISLIVFDFPETIDGLEALRAQASDATIIV